MALFLSSCDEENNSLLTPSLTKTTSLPTTLLDSIKDIGMYHNKISLYLLNEYSYLAENICNNNSSDYINSGEMFNYTYNTYNYISDSTWMDTSLLDTTLVYNNYESLEDVGITNGLSNNAVYYLRKLDSLIEQYYIDDNINLFVSSCNMILLNSVSLSDDMEKVVVGAAASTLMNSAQLWRGNTANDLYTTIVNPTNYNGVQTPTAALTREERNDRLIEADGIGAAAGAIRGGLTAAPGGPGGIVVGAIVGATFKGAAFTLEELIEIRTGAELPWWAKVVMAAV
jgi:hypothetical protein